MNNISLKKMGKIFPLCALLCFCACEENSPELLFGNQITEFSITIDNAEMALVEGEISFKNVSILAVINQSDRIITATVPFGTDLTNLAPEIIKVSERATVTPATGVTGANQDFSKLVSYTVKAENGSSNTYGVYLRKAEKPVLTGVTNSLKLGETATLSGQNLKINGFKTQVKFVYLYDPSSRIAALLEAAPNADGTEATLVLPDNLPKQTYLVSIVVGGVESEGNEILNVEY